MGMDIYARTLTRYYAQNWKTAAQQFAEENGWDYQRIMPEGTSPEERDALSLAEIQADMEQWQDWLLKALTPEGRVTQTRPFKNFESENFSLIVHSQIAEIPCRRYLIR